MKLEGLLWGAAWLGAMWACNSDDAESAKPVTDAGSDAAQDAGPRKLAQRSFSGFTAWASPIEDYLAVGQSVQGDNFNHSINDLAAMGDRLFIAYGDADYNLGEHTPIEIRYFASPDDPTAQPATIDGAGQGEVQTTPYQSGEEQIDRYRLLDGVLWQAGIDSIDPDELWTQANTSPKGIQGNIYRFEGDGWKKFRSINGGEHVHDATRYKGALYAVGSGADTRLEFEGGQIFRYLWRSSDQGVSFETVQRVQYPLLGAGDTRWVTLLPTSGNLYLFGYEAAFAGNSANVMNAQFDGQAVTNLPPTHSLAKLFPDDVLVLSDTSTVLWGADVTVSPTRHTAGTVSADGTFQALATLAGATLVDAALASDSDEIVYLVTAGDEYGATKTSYDVRVLVADVGDPDTTTELMSFTTSIEPTSIAAWKGALFLGTADGHVEKAVAN